MTLVVGAKVNRTITQGRCSIRCSLAAELSCRAEKVDGDPLGNASLVHHNAAEVQHQIMSNLLRAMFKVDCL